MLTLGLSGKIQIATGKDGYNRQGRKSLPCKGLTTTIDNKLLLTLELLQFVLRAMSVEFSTIRYCCLRFFISIVVHFIRPGTNSRHLFRKIYTPTAEKLCHIYISLISLTNLSRTKEFDTPLKDKT